MVTSEKKAINKEKEQFFSKPAGYLLDKFSLLVMFGGLLIAVWYGQVVIVIVLALTLSAAGLTSLWSRLSLAGVNYKRLLSERRVFPGEQIEFKLRLENRKLLPLPWIQVSDEIPSGLTSDVSFPPSSRPGFCLLSKGAALLWYTGISWKQVLHCQRRGYYSLGPFTMTSGDIFGFYSRSVTMPLLDHVIVYPEIFPVAKLAVPSLHPVGETLTQQRIFEDPIRVIGVRDYSPHDSRRRIHWKASARHQNLQVKVFEPTTTLKIAIFLAVDSFKHHYNREYVDDDFELGVSAAASIANHLITEKRSATGLFTNSCLADSGQSARILPGSSAGQLVEILEALAKVTHQASCSFEEFVEIERRSLVWGTTLVFIVSKVSQSLGEMLIGLKENGYKLLVLQVGESEKSEVTKSITWHTVKQPGDLIKIGVTDGR